MKFVIIIILLLLNFLNVSAAPPSSTPATVTKEADLVIVTLSTEAEQSLRLKTVPMSQSAVPEVRYYAGQVVLPLGAEGNEQAPVFNGGWAEALLLADQQVIADGGVLEAEVAVELARKALDRARTILAAEAGSARAVEEADAAWQVAKVRLMTAKLRRELLGDPLKMISNNQSKWVRVAIYSGEEPLLDPKSKAMVSAIGYPSERYEAESIKGPQTANGLTNTVDWYFKLPEETGFRAGERIAVEIRTKASYNERLVVPFSAVLHDIHGGQWVYEKTSDHTFTRRRIQVERVFGTDAALLSGPAIGSLIVTDGATELFGTEFMTGK